MAILKKVLPILFILVFVLSGCGEAKSDTNSETLSTDNTQDASFKTTLSDQEFAENVSSNANNIEDSSSFTSATNSSQTISTSNESTTLSSNVADLSKIKADLISNKANVFELNYQSERLDINSINLTKRKIENDTDTVYVSVEFGNDAYGVSTEMILYYFFYDVGGWILEHYDIMEYNSFAKKPYYTNETLSAYLNQSFNSSKVAQRKHGADSQGIYRDDISFSAKATYSYMTASVEGKITMQFKNDVWQKQVVFNKINCDWSKCIGTWKYIHQTGDYVIFDIEDMSQSQIDNSIFSGEIAYSYSTSPWKWVDEIYGVNYVDYSEPLKTKTYMGTCEKVEWLGMTINLPQRVYITISLGGQYWGDDKPHITSTGVHSVFMDKDDGVKLSIVPKDSKGSKSFSVVMNRIG